MIQKINDLPGTLLPKDKGVDEGAPIGAVDYVIEGGDIANRMEVPDQSAAASWGQFETDYIKGIHVRTTWGKRLRYCSFPATTIFPMLLVFIKL